MMRRGTSLTVGLTFGWWAGTSYLKWRRLPTFTGSDASGVFGDPSLPPLSIAVLGDSSCTGPGLDHIEDVWIQRVGRALGEDFRTTIDSFAVGGAKAVDVLSSQLPKLEHYDVAIVSVGPNDMLRGVAPSVFEDRLDAIVGSLPADSVVLSGVGDLSAIPRLPTLLRWPARARGMAADRAHDRVAGTRPNVFKVPIWDRAPDFHSNRTLWAADLFHASAEGHAVYADVAMPAIRAAIDHAVTDRRSGNPTTP
ncbi:MAG: GDSL-type esterase/lipase family protein [Acidimicrobiia bacterium]